MSRQPWGRAPDNRNRYISKEPKCLRDPGPDRVGGVPKLNVLHIAPKIFGVKSAFPTANHLKKFEMILARPWPKIVKRRSCCVCGTGCARGALVGLGLLGVVVCLKNRTQHASLVVLLEHAVRLIVSLIKR